MSNRVDPAVDAVELPAPESTHDPVPTDAMVEKLAQAEDSMLLMRQPGDDPIRVHALLRGTLPAGSMVRPPLCVDTPHNGGLVPMEVSIGHRAMLAAEGARVAPGRWREV